MAFGLERDVFEEKIDTLEIPDREYDVREGEDQRHCRWKKWNGKWQVK
jgi:hypothetical protein